MEIKVEVDNLSLSDVIHEGDEYNRSVTVADMVVDRIVSRLVGSNDMPDLYRRVASIRDDVIREHLQPLISAALNKPVQKTNEYGRPRGEPIPLTELILTEVKSYLGKPLDRNIGRTETVVQKLIREEVERALLTELRDVIAEEKKRIVAAMRSKAAGIIAATIEAGLGR